MSMAYTISKKTQSTCSGRNASCVTALFTLRIIGFQLWHSPGIKQCIAAAQALGPPHIAPYLPIAALLNNAGCCPQLSSTVNNKPTAGTAYPAMSWCCCHSFAEGGDYSDQLPLAQHLCNMLLLTPSYLPYTVICYSYYKAAAEITQRSMAGVQGLLLLLYVHCTMASR